MPRPVCSTPWALPRRNAARPSTVTGETPAPSPRTIRASTTHASWVTSRSTARRRPCAPASGFRPGRLRRLDASRARHIHISKGLFDLGPERLLFWVVHFHGPSGGDSAQPSGCPGHAPRTQAEPTDTTVLMTRQQRPHHRSKRPHEPTSRIPLVLSLIHI